MTAVSDDSKTAAIDSLVDPYVSTNSVPPLPPPPPPTPDSLPSSENDVVWKWLIFDLLLLRI